MKKRERAKFCKHFAQMLKRERQDRQRLTRPELAAKSGVSVNAIRDIENGKRHPVLVNAYALARGLGVPLSQLCNGLFPEGGPPA